MSASGGGTWSEVCCGLDLEADRFAKRWINARRAGSLDALQPLRGTHNAPNRWLRRGGNTMGVQLWTWGLTAALAGFSGPTNDGEDKPVGVETKSFGKLLDGGEAKLYTLKNKHGIV